MVQSEVPVVPECFLASGKTHGEEQKNTYVTIRNTSKQFVSSLNSRQTVHNTRAASHWRNGRGWPKK